MENQKSKPQTNRSKRGQSMVEFALLLPLLLVLVVSTIDLGRLFFTKIVITNAARESAYYLTMNPSDYDPGTGNAPNAAFAAQRDASNSGVSDITVTFTPTTSVAPGEESVIVTVETQVDNLLLLGFLGDLFSLNVVHQGAFSLSSSVEMMVQ
ncbi:MAG: TadE family protein [Pseudomonadota bacterium]|jgi:Flp pilus assembly protein TadG|nr:TadE family protein [Pseudomonadota bacterium]